MLVLAIANTSKAKGGLRSHLRLHERTFLNHWKFHEGYILAQEDIFLFMKTFLTAKIFDQQIWNTNVFYPNILSP